MNETKLCIELLCLTIRDEAYIAAVRNMGFDVLQDLAHDSFSQAFTLVFSKDGNIHNLKEASTVANDSAHSHGL